MLGGAESGREGSTQSGQLKYRGQAKESHNVFPYMKGRSPSRDEFTI